MANSPIPQLKMRASDLYRLLEEMEQRVQAKTAQLVAEWLTTRYVPVMWDGVIPAGEASEAFTLQEVVPDGFEWPLGTVALIRWETASEISVVSQVTEPFARPAGQIGHVVWLTVTHLVEQKSPEKGS